MHRISGDTLAMWLVETGVMAERGQPILSLVTRVFLSDGERIMGQLRETGHELLLCYALQQVAQYRKAGKEFAMQHAGTEYLDDMDDELQTILAGMPVETRLRGLPAEERLRGLTPVELAEGLAAEQAAGLRELLDRK